MKSRWKERSEKDTDGTLLERVLKGRGIGADESYLNPTFSDLHETVKIPDIKKALERIERALKNNEKITVYSDYDCDGTLGGAILIRYLRALGANVDYYIPNRLKEGYGLNSKALREISENGTDLIITVDNGISALPEAAEIDTLGMDLIVTDHHETSKNLPQAEAVLDCKREDSLYPFRELCGAGLVYKLILALNEHLGVELPTEEYLQMAMIATVADIVPLVDENRTLVKLGLESFNKNGFIHKGLNKLYELSGLEKLTSGDIGYRIAPVINAAGRLGEVEDAMKLLIEEDLEISEELFNKNKERIKIENELTVEALKVIKSQKLYEEDIIVVGGKNWHPGVIGIVASRIQDYWHKPVIVIGYDEEGIGRGSCRSVKGFDIFKALSSTEEVFLNFGGHSQAAGFSIERKNVDKMIENLRKFCAQYDMDELSVIEYTYDLKVKTDELKMSEVEELEKLAPFGVSNPAPTFLIEGERINNLKYLGKEKKHLGFNVDGIRAVGFNMGDKLFSIAEPVRILAKAEINCYNNRKNLQLNVKDIKSSPYNCFFTAETFLSEYRTPEKLLEALTEFAGKREIERKLLVLTYNLIKKSAPDFPVETFLNISGGNLFELAACLRILKEAKLIDYRFKDGKITAHLIPVSKKADLTTTPTYILIEETNKLQRDGL